VELSVSDSIKLGIQAPVRDSGDVEGTPGIILTSQKNKLEMKKGVIIAKRHLHLDPGTAKKMGLQDKDLINVSLKTKRPIRLDQVAVRVSDAYKTDLHIDLDEANAAQAKNGDKAVLIWEA
jgi:putative phosphotransacetylase